MCIASPPKPKKTDRAIRMHLSENKRKRSRYDDRTDELESCVFVDCESTLLLLHAIKCFGYIAESNYMATWKRASAKDKIPRQREGLSVVRLARWHAIDRKSDFVRRNDMQHELWKIRLTPSLRMNVVLRFRKSGSWYTTNQSFIF